MTIDVRAVRRRFPALDAAPRRIVHADAPGGTQVPERVIAAMSDHLRDANANAHGAFPTSQATDETCARVRRALGGFLGSEPEGIVFGPNMTTLTLRLARALESRLAPGDTIVCTQLDHDANVAPWLIAAGRSGAEVRFVGLRDDGTLDPDDLERAAEARPRLFAFPAASNALGTLVDPAPFVAAARSVGALTFCDAVHAAPHVALDRRLTGVDVVACSPYKFFGPHAGVLAADPELLADLSPDKVRPAPDTGPERWQTGTANFEAIAGIEPAVAHLSELGMDAVAAHERRLTARFLAGIADMEHVSLHGPATPEGRTPTFAITVEAATPDEVAAHLAERGVYVWAGHYYAIEPMRALGLLGHGGAVRIGFVHYHDTTDVDLVLDALDDR